MNDIVVLVIQLLFGLLFVATLWSYLRQRDPLSRDVMLVFAAVASIFVVGLVQNILGASPPWLSAATGALLLAHPLFLLRVCMHTRYVPRSVFWVAALAYAAAVLPILVLPSRPSWANLPAVAVFVAIEGLAAWYLTAGALERTGAARTRLLTAAVATALFAGALLLAGVSGINPVLAGVGEVVVPAMALLAAAAYAVAFLPIRWLRRLWEATAALRFTQALIDDPAATPDDAWRQLAETALRITGASTALVVTGDRGRSITFNADEAVDSRGPLGEKPLSELRQAVQASRPLPVDAVPELAAALGVESPRSVLSALSFETRLHGPATLAWVSPRRSLFASDDRELLELLGRRAAVFAERAAMMAEQASLNQRLAATNEALAAASKAKSDFLASMSHELRTPLSAIIGFSALMREEPPDGERVSVLREWVEHIHSSGEHLLSLINDVLDLSKVEAGRLELHPETFDLSQAVGELVGGMRPLAQSKRIGLTFEVPAIEVTADRGRLRQILYNLVANALRFTPDGGKALITAERSLGEIRISVSDTGIGIAAEDQERIFGEFQQVGDPAAHQEGTGLGLALTRRLVEAHGGRIELESTPGRGSRFTVILPQQAAGLEPAAESARTPAPEASPASPAAASTARDILVIEDDPGAVRLLRTYLEGAGHPVRVAGDGRAGLAEARRKMPAAIVLDVLLPDIDGWDVLRKLKADRQLRDVPVVVVTVVDERQLGLTLGAVDYFLKPVDRDALLARLSRYTFTTKVRQRTVRVLVVDDDPLARSMVEAALRPAGFEVVAAATGREGIDRVREGGIDLVICDLLMPDHDGFEVVAQLAGDEATSHVPILILTAHDLSDADKERLNGQIVGVLSKHEVELPAALQRWLARATPGGIPAAGLAQPT